ncbi:MAG: hypothetical protein V1872_13800 [bacterium]
MYQKSTSKYNMPITIIYPGEFYATSGREVIHTVLGSCVSACLFDELSEVGGMNHFMLPGSFEKAFYLEKSGRYGMFAMELLINEVLKLGADRRRLRAKVFGGGHIIESFRKTDGNVPQSNIKFIREYLMAEDIPVLSEDLGGEHGRRVFFFTENNEVLISRIKKQSFVTSTAEQEEEQYKCKLFNDAAKGEK